MNLIYWDQNVYQILAGSYAIFGAVSEMKACGNSQSLEVVSRYRDPQLQVTENYLEDDA